MRGMVVKIFGRLYSEFLPTKRSIVQENGVRRAHEVPTSQGACPGGRALPPPSWMPRVLFGLLIFLFSEIFQNGEKLPLELFWSWFTYRTTYLFLFGVWNILKSVLYIFLRGHGFNNIGFNIYRITWDIMFDSLTVYHLRICAFEVVDFYGIETIELLIM